MAVTDFLKAGNKESYELLKSAIKKETLSPESLAKIVPVVLSKLKKKDVSADAIVSNISILIAIANKHLLDSIKKEATLYIKLIDKHDASELVCRNIMGLLFVLASDKAVATIQLKQKIIPILMRILKTYPESEKVHEGLVRLIKRLAFCDKKLIIDSGVTDNFIDFLGRMVDDDELHHDAIIEMYTELLIFLSNDTIKKRVADLVHIADLAHDISYINIDKVLTPLGFTVTGKTIAVPYTALTPKFGEIVKPVAPLKRKAHVYMNMGHSSELMSDEPIPVPAGCVYVTFAICGLTTTEGFKILRAFSDSNIRKMLHDPVNYVHELTAYFGESLHIHYPEATNAASRTYYDVRYTPLADFYRGKCLAVKSGLYKMGDVSDFSAPPDLATEDEGRKDFMIEYNCNTVSYHVLSYLYSKALYPNKRAILNSFDGRPISNEMLGNELKKYRYSQSWAFSKFPGVHYNFVCRGHGDNKKYVNHTRRRVAESRAAASELLKKQTRRAN